MAISAGAKFQWLNSVIMGRFSDRKFPLTVGFELTQLCNLNCAYCDVNEKKSDDLTTSQVKEIITGLAQAGSHSISYDGGEVLLRKDIQEIVDHTHSLGVKARLNSNGLLVPRNVHKLKNLTQIKLSLDGPRDIHDSIRGKGVFDAVLRAVEAAKNHDINVGLSAVISRFNEDRVLEVADLAKAWEVPVTFQPCANQTDLSSAINPKGQSPDVKKYRFAIDQLIEARKENPYIGNKAVGLKHLREWPDPTLIPCYAGKYFVTIDHNGKLYSCGRFNRGNKAGIDLVGPGVAKALEELEPAGGCGHCWCARRAESNLGFDLDIQAVVLNRYRYGKSSRE